MNKIASIEHNTISCKIRFTNSQDNNIVVKIVDSTHYCCEKFGVYKMYNDKNYEDNLDQYIGKTIKDIEVYYVMHFDDTDHYKEKVYHKPTYDDVHKTIKLDNSARKYPSQVHVILFFEDLPKDKDKDKDKNKDEDETPDHLEIIAYNAHNGYYYHECYVELNNILINGYHLHHKEHTKL